ncbi:MAG: hypothetical protein ACREQ8_03400, partial [Woeseiaceae bacterium]
AYSIDVPPMSSIVGTTLAVLALLTAFQGQSATAQDITREDFFIGGDADVTLFVREVRLTAYKKYFRSWPPGVVPTTKHAILDVCWRRGRHHRSGYDASSWRTR